MSTASQGKASAARSSWEVLAGALLARALDYPTVTFGAVMLGACLWQGRPWWDIAGVVIASAALGWFVREYETKWRDRRRFMRAWKGTPEHEGWGAVLGLANKNGKLPKITRYKREAGTRVVDFSMVPGVTVDEFLSATTKLADAVKAHRAQIEKVDPGWVRVRFIDVDLMKEGREAEWTKDFGLQDNSPIDDSFDGLEGWFEGKKEEDDE